MNEPTRVFLVDDTATVRHLLSQILEEDPGIEVVGTAANGREGLTRLERIQADVLVLDIEMPGMDGLEMLRRLKEQGSRLPVIVFSSVTERGAMVTIEALSLGASDYVTKPSMTGSAAEARDYISAALVKRIHALAAKTGGRVAPTRPASATSEPSSVRAALPGPSSQRVDAVVIGVSMGGPGALGSFLPALPADLPVPVFIVQHMPALFISALARRLSDRCALPVRECDRAMPVQPGQVLIATGGHHMALSGSAGCVEAAPSDAEPVNFCRPAADILFENAVGIWGANLLGVVMTGMGQDGVAGARAIRQAGGDVIVQDEASSVVWGMAGGVFRAGLANEAVALPALAGRVCERVARERHWHAPTPTSVVTEPGAAR